MGLKIQKADEKGSNSQILAKFARLVGITYCCFLSFFHSTDHKSIAIRGEFLRLNGQASHIRGRTIGASDMLPTLAEGPSARRTCFPHWRKDPRRVGHASHIGRRAIGASDMLPTLAEGPSAHRTCFPHWRKDHRRVGHASHIEASATRCKNAA